MNKNEFLNQLEKLLSDLPEEERREAMEYYVEYFDEAGPEKEEEVLKELGSPQKIADHIREDLMGKKGENATQEKKKDDNNAWKVVGIVLLCILAAPIALPILIALVAAAAGLITGLFSAVIGLFLGACGVTLAFFVATFVLLVVGIMTLFSAPLVGFLLIGVSIMCAGLTLLFGFLIVKFCMVGFPAICKGIYNLCKKLFGKKKEEA